MISRSTYLKKRLNTSLLIVFFMFIVSTTLTTLAAAEISFTESTQEAGLTYTGPTWGAQWADYNGDGWPDIWVTNHESKEPSLYLNKGNGTFEQISDSIWEQKPWPYTDTHGAGWADFDNDGDQDILVSTGGKYEHNFFYINNQGMLYDGADEYGLEFTENRGRMPLWLDFDNDGLLDVYLNGFASDIGGYATLFRQNEETGVFENVNSLVGFDDHGALFSLLSDLTGDGVLDIISYGGWLRFPRYLFNTGTIPFTEERNKIFPIDTGYADDAAFADFNGDLLPDLYLARGGGDEQVAQVTSTKLAANILEDECGCEKGITFKSDGTVTILFSVQYESRNHPFYIGSSGFSPEDFPSYISPDDPRIWGMSPRIPVYLELNPADPRVHGISAHTPGVDVGVYIGFDTVLNEWKIVSSQSLDQTFWCKFIVETDAPVTEFTPLNVNLASLSPSIDSLYIHNGARLEEVPSQQSGINKHLAGRSVVAGDFDNDMDMDIYVVNSLKVMNTPNILFENDGTGVFTEVPDAGGAAGTLLGAGESVITADYNRDGFLDLFITNGHYPSPFDHLGPIQLFKNNGNSNHWIEIDLVGTISNRDGIGARLLVTAGGKTQFREQSGGMHKYSQNHTRIHFGLGQNSIIQRLEIQWPSGIVQVLENLEADKIIKIVESSSAPQPPVAVGDSARTNMDTATTVNVLVNDYDPNSDTLTITAVQSPTDQGGIAAVNDNGTSEDPGDDFIDYTPPGGFAGTDTFTYTIDDGSGFTATATVIVTVEASTSCNPYGEPTYDLATEDGIFLWKEGHVWHLRAVAGLSGWQKYTGSIVSDMEFISVTPVSLEETDTLDTSNSQVITFDLRMSRSYFDGLDFEFPAGATVHLDVQSYRGNAIDLVFIGGNRCPIDQLPYQLPLDSNILPVAVFTADPVLGEAPLYVNFNASMSYDPDADGSIVSYEWDYGDGTAPESGLTISSHTYYTPGIYTVTLTVTDNAGATATTSQAVTVVGTSTTCNPYGEPEYDPATEDGVFLWKEGNIWHLRAIAGFSGSQKYTGSIVSDMDFISVTPVSVEANDILNTSNSQAIIFGMTVSRPYFDGLDFEFPADASVYFDVEASSGSAADLVFIGEDPCVVQLPYQLSPDSNTLPMAGFSADPVLGEVPLNVTFDASLSYDPDGSIVSYAWDYGDGTGSGVTTSHTYNTPGTYNVILTVTDDHDATDTISRIITVGTLSTCNPYGESNYDPATEDGIFLWKEGNVWHLRAVAGLSGTQKYTGNIISDMEFISATPVSLEANDILDTSNAQMITFAMTMSRPYFDGLDFEFPAGAAVYVDVQSTSGVAADLVFLGGDQCPVEQLPCQLPSGL